MDSSTVTVILGVLVIVAVVVGLNWIKGQAEKAEAAREAPLIAAAQQEFQSFAEAAQQDRLPTLNDRVVGVILKPNEKCVALAFSVEQIVPVKSTRYVGGSQGVSVHIAKGVNYRIGAFRGRPITTVSEKVGDVGNLYVTDHRVIFAGRTNITTLPINKVADARVDADRLLLVPENKPNPLVFRLAEKYRAPLLAAATHLMANQPGLPRSAPS